MTRENRVKSEALQKGQAVTHVIAEDDLSHEERVTAFSELAKLLDIGLTPTQAVDVYAIDVLDVDREKWSSIRGIETMGVNQNLYHGRSRFKKEYLDAETQEVEP